jgi:hypothetical protein
MMVEMKAVMMEEKLVGKKGIKKAVWKAEKMDKRLVALTAELMV